MKTNLNNVNAFIEYENVLSEMLSWCQKFVRPTLSYEDVKTPDSVFWKQFPKMVERDEFNSIDFSDINVVYDVIKAFIDYIPTYTDIDFFNDFYKYNIQFVLESPERTVRFFNCVAFDILFIDRIIEVRPFLVLPINEVNLKDREFYKRFWTSFIATQNIKPEFYHKHINIFLADKDLATHLTCSHVYWILSQAFRNMIYKKWFQIKE